MELVEVKDYLSSFLPTLGYKLYSYSVSKEGGSLIMHICIDRRNYIDLNSISEVTTKILEELEKNLSIQEEYQIDCYSAGVEKELSIEDLPSYLDEYVYVSIHHAVDKQDYLIGYLKEVTSEKISIEMNFSGRKKIIKTTLSNIAKIRLAIK